MDFKPMFILGVVTGLLIVAAIAVAIYFITGQNKRPCKFDERQALARLKAFRAAFWTLVAYLCLNGLYESATDQKWGDFIVEPFVGVCIAMMVFAILCIFYDAYLALNEKRSFCLWMFAIIAGGNGLLAAMNMGEDEMLTDGLVNFHAMNLVVFVMFVILFIALAIKAFIERRRKTE